MVVCLVFTLCFFVATSSGSSALKSAVNTSDSTHGALQSPPRDIEIPFPNFGRTARLKFAERRKNQRRELIQNLRDSINDQLILDDSGGFVSGQRICLPLKNTRGGARLKSNTAGASGTLVSKKPFDPNILVVRAMRQIIHGEFESRMGRSAVDRGIPTPKKRWRVNYRHENHTYIDLGKDFDMDDKSFTITALIRLRPSSGDKKSNRGARILSKRDSNNFGWEFVVPSYYTQTVSFYANQHPGHIDYGRSSIPGNQWTTVSIVVDRHTYENDVAVITPYIDGLPDGRGTFMQIIGNISSDALLTVGHARDENGHLSEGRRDFRLPGSPKYNPHFHGDIRDIFVWHTSLHKQQMRKHAAQILREIGRKPNPCPLGYEQLDCRCYQVFDDLRTYELAESACRQEGGMLAMPKTERIQDFLEILMQQSNMWSFWIGLDDRVQERRKVWADKSELHYRNISQFTKFPRGIPDKQYHTEDCVEELKTRPEFVWNDENCIKLNAYICEVKNTRNECTAAKL
uniref:Uncharacterized protein LOC100184082 n=1 Tax=Phallusia mammillata TaxID=59560 RepID=A0A6F9DIW4_9ASCI|nr:uncharacterized protein LOC100184082 [Phallusia mammillata]